MDSQRSEHKVVLPDEVWSETLIQARLEQKTASEICEYVLRYYTQLSVEERPAILFPRASGQQRSIYIEQQVWLDLITCKIKERRPISAILEQQLRAYLGLP
ncbi:MAG: hypothetical protein IPL78_27160 [Chloroflexi bacterium]|nr:hypothetical protein [Chloroflexota bacterium]MBP8000040.1 hypothetical protein [Chloroflexota bacterium]MBP8057124.1 hypothetical protein [Chloroflexota bacterium]